MLRVYINVRETGRDNQKWINPETQEILGTRHRQKTKYKQANKQKQKHTTQKAIKKIVT